MEVSVTQLDRPVVCLFRDGHWRYFRGWLKAHTSPAKLRVVGWKYWIQAECLQELAIEPRRDGILIEGVRDGGALRTEGLDIPEP
ncbi:hypothetical protein KC326_g147 [Hortaea werneckii]|nr:hypothetical protein KC326_g147 [Hortaea werneckii]